MRASTLISLPHEGQNKISVAMTVSAIQITLAAGEAALQVQHSARKQHMPVGLQN
jgi:hypothetical protein